MTINRSIKGEYHTQRNNRIVPHKACNVTSKAMWYKYNGFRITPPKGKQPEDWFAELLDSDRAHRYMAAHFPWAVGEFPPREVHGMLVWLDGEIMERTVSRFDNAYPVRSHLWRLLQGEVLIWSGLFCERLHHVVCGVGFETDQTDVEDAEDPDDIDLNRVTAFIMDDPYGNWRTDYRDHRGDDIRMPVEVWGDTMKPLGNRDAKRAHYVAVEV